MAEAEMTEDEKKLADARKLIAEADAAEMAKVQKDLADRIDKIKPIQELLDDPAFVKAIDTLVAQQPTFAPDLVIGPHVTGIIVCMANLRAAIAAVSGAAAAASAGKPQPAV